MFESVFGKGKNIPKKCEVCLLAKVYARKSCKRYVIIRNKVAEQGTDPPNTPEQVFVFPAILKENKPWVELDALPVEPRARLTLYAIPATCGENEEERLLRKIKDTSNAIHAMLIIYKKAFFREPYVELIPDTEFWVSAGIRKTQGFQWKITWREGIKSREKDCFQIKLKRRKGRVEYTVSFKEKGLYAQKIDVAPLKFMIDWKQ